MNLEVRKIVSVVETTRREMGRPVEGCHRKVATAVVFTNPLAGRYVEDAAYTTDLGQQVAADSMAHVRKRTRMLVEEHPVVHGN
jgi:Amino acid synthesis